MTSASLEYPTPSDLKLSLELVIHLSLYSSNQVFQFENRPGGNLLSGFRYVERLSLLDIGRSFILKLRPMFILYADLR